MALTQSCGWFLVATLTFGWYPNARGMITVNVQSGMHMNPFVLDGRRKLPERIRHYACTSLDGPECFLYDGSKKPVEEAAISKLGQLLGNAIETSFRKASSKKKAKRKKKKEENQQVKADKSAATDAETGNGDSAEVLAGEKVARSSWGSSNRNKASKPRESDENDDIDVEDDDEIIEQEEDDTEVTISVKDKEQLEALGLGNLMDVVKTLQRGPKMATFRVLPNGETEQVPNDELDQLISKFSESQASKKKRGKGAKKKARQQESDDSEEEDEEDGQSSSKRRARGKARKTTPPEAQKIAEMVMKQLGIGSDAIENTHSIMIDVSDLQDGLEDEEDIVSTLFGMQGFGEEADEGDEEEDEND